MEDGQEMSLVPPPSEFEAPHKKKAISAKQEVSEASTRWKGRIHTAVTIILATFVFLSACVAAYTYAYPAWKTTELVAKIMAPAGEHAGGGKRDCSDPCGMYTEQYPTASASIPWYSSLPCPSVPPKVQEMARSAARLFGQDPSHIVFSCTHTMPYWNMGDTAAINSHLIVHALESPQDEFAYAPYAALPAMAAAGMPTAEILNKIKNKPMGSARELPSRFTVQQIMVTAAIQQVCAHAAAVNRSASVAADLAPFMGCHAARE